MDSPSSNANPQPVSDVSNQNEEEKGSPSVDPSQSSEETIPMDHQGPLHPPLDALQMAIRDENREYGCKYCDKKFSNKQALGGHQNAHKVERALEKNARDVQENSLGYFGAPSAPSFLSSYHRSHDFMNRSYLTWPYPSQQHGIYGPPRPVPGFSNAYSGWPRIPRCPGPHPSFYMMPNQQALNLRFPTIGAGSSSFIRPVSEHQGPSAFAGTSRIGPNGNPGDGDNVDRMNGLGNELVDDSGLDLTLKL